MSNTKKIWSGKINSFYILLAFFAVTLFTLFFYLINIDKNIKNYDEYRKELQIMRSINYEIETVFHQINSWKSLAADAKQMEKKFN